ncbi:DnaJ C terminal domain-containing protein [Lentinula aciculospora]|uniref:DnaJ C terminal domain-containing protein n=1 Tax=Lentinula aciculospora TaxID=153920 RepID=A0A9W9A8Q5_9AGAR|nr:DnaJ C terminal domain-containing protein [Lentinula aciculospora]
MAWAYTLAVLFFSALAAAKDLYKILDIHPSSSKTDVRHAYKKLSRKYHPDKNQDPDAKDKFVDIAYGQSSQVSIRLKISAKSCQDIAAYEVLADEEKRQIYDRHGEEGLKAHEGGQTQHGNPFDIFSNFFGDGYASQQVRRGPTSLTEFEVELADIYKGASIDFMIKKRILCDHCRGSGAASDGDIHTCSGCGGSGVKLVKQQIFPGMFAQSQTTCNECGGRGKIIHKKCPHCDGMKVTDHTAHYTLEVIPGMPEGHEVVFEGEGDESPDWESGDVILRVRSRKDKGGWRRKESSLYWRETIGIDEALLGFDRNLTHLDGHEVRLMRKGPTQPGFVQKIEGEGMPLFENHNLHGDLFVEYNVVLPIELTLQQRRKLSEAFQTEAAHDEL